MDHRFTLLGMCYINLIFVLISIYILGSFKVNAFSKLFLVTLAQDCIKNVSLDLVR